MGKKLNAKKLICSTQGKLFRTEFLESNWKKASGSQNLRQLLFFAFYHTNQIQSNLLRSLGSPELSH